MSACGGFNNTKEFKWRGWLFFRCDLDFTALGTGIFCRFVCVSVGLCLLRLPQSRHTCAGSDIYNAGRNNDVLLPEIRWSKKQQNGIQASAVAARHAELSQGQERDGKDDINQFLKPEESEETKGNDLKNNDTWMQVAKRPN